MRITVEDLAWGGTILSGVSLRIEPGETVGLVGPNGSGKSSLLRCMAGLRTPASGVVRYGEHDISGWTARRIAQHVAFVEQDTDAESELRVADVVGLGRTPFTDRWRGLGDHDRLIVEAALDRVGLTALAARSWKTLSGGERQRAHIARSLAQRPRCILLDEPTNHLDIKHQIALMNLLTTTDQTVLVAMHDLAMAARYCDRLLLMHGGTLVAGGPPSEVLTPERLRAVFEIDAEVERDSMGNLTVLVRT